MAHQGLLLLWCLTSLPRRRFALNFDGYHTLSRRKALRWLTFRGKIAAFNLLPQFLNLFVSHSTPLHDRYSWFTRLHFLGLAIPDAVEATWASRWPLYEVWFRCQRIHRGFIEVLNFRSIGFQSVSCFSQTRDGCLLWLSFLADYSSFLRASSLQPANLRSFLKFTVSLKLKAIINCNGSRLGPILFPNGHRTTRLQPADQLVSIHTSNPVSLVQIPFPSEKYAETCMRTIGVDPAFSDSKNKKSSITRDMFLEVLEGGVTYLTIKFSCSAQDTN